MDDPTPHAPAPRIPVAALAAPADAEVGASWAQDLPPRSTWGEAGAMAPDVVRLVRSLATDPRVPWRAKVVAAAAATYAVLPVGPFPDVVPGVGVDDVVALLFAVRHLVGTAGYDLVREHWTGTDAAFGLLIVLAGVDR